MSTMLDDFDLTPLVEAGLAWVGETEQGILIIAGIAPQWENRATVWSLVSPMAGKHFRKIHREVKRHLDEAPFRRLEATVDVGFGPGHRWMKMLGFEMEGYLRAFRPDGADQIMYSRINDVRT